MQKLVRKQWCLIWQIIKKQEIAEAQKVDTLILGAFGADVFGQKGMEIAKIFRDILKENYWSFQNVIFAIPDYRRYGNYNKFRKVIKEN